MRALGIGARGMDASGPARTPSLRVARSGLMLWLAALMGWSVPSVALAQPYMTPDQFLEDQVVIRLARSPALAGSQVKVASEQREVTLTGALPSKKARERAERIARRTPGVRSVLNLTSVQSTLGQVAFVSDEELAEAVAKHVAALFPAAKAERTSQGWWKIEGETWRFDIEVDQGHVTAEGTVDAVHDVRAVVETAWQTPGTVTVVSDLLALETKSLSPGLFGGSRHFYYDVPPVPE